MERGGEEGGVFEELQAVCPPLFELLQKDKQTASSLARLKAYVGEAPLHGLQPCLDYVLFPLLVLLDASVACRSTKTSSGKDGGPFMISDSVSEDVLSCLEDVLKRCSLTSTDQLSMLLRKLTSGALLSPSEASEEFRHGIVKCLRAVLLGLKPCVDEACMCKTVPLSPFFISDLGLLCNMKKDDVVSNLQTKVVNSDCLIAFLQSENASAAVGHLLSLLLQIAETEARRGHRGSGKLRSDSISTLRVLISKVGSADALAFFLPGIVSGLTKVLRGSKFTTVESFQPTSGAAGSIGTIEQAVKGLGEILVLCLADDQNPTLLDISIAETNNEGLSGTLSRNYKSADLALEALRCFSFQMHAKKDVEVAQEVPFHTLHGKKLQQNKDQTGEPQGYGIGAIGSNFHVYRDKEWHEQTARNVDSFLSSIFPVLCTHPARVVRLGLAEAAGALLSMCNKTLSRIKAMLLECLLALAFDDWESVSLIAHDYLSVLFSSEGIFMEENELNTVFNRLIQRFPKAILQGDESTALAHARRLLAAMYFSGPEVVSRQLFDSPAAIGCFLDVMRQCLSHTLAFTGPIEDMVNHRAPSAGHLLVISELSSDSTTEENGVSLSQASTRKLDSHALQLEEPEMSRYFENMAADECLPRMPPWFNHAGGQKLYELIAAIIRLAGLSAVAGCTETFSLSILIEIPLEALRHTISELRVKEYKQEDWYTWYDRHRSGHVLHDAATAVCLLSEIIFGASSRSMSTYANLFKSSSRLQDKSIGGIGRMPDECVLNYLSKNIPHSLQKWEMSTGTGLSQNVIECVGSISYEYLSSEIWDLPIDFSSPGLIQCSGNAQLPWHFFQDTAMLQQVILEGLGVFGISLGKYFETSGFLYSSLYLLLEKLSCSNYHMQRAADISLQMLFISAGYSSIKDMVVSNIDYIIDSLCRQLRHLTLNPRAPNILAVVLSTSGATRDILPLLEEPIRSISLELEVIGRQQHPDLTVPILKALDEIVKALTREAHSVTQESLGHGWHIKLKVEYLKEKQKLQSGSSDLSVVISSGSCKEKTDTFIVTDPSEESKFSGYVLTFEHWEEVLLAINDRKRYCHSVGTVVGLCLKASIPLLGSQKQAACLKALDIVQNATATLSMIEEALNSEIKSREAIEWVADQFSFHALQDIINRADAGQDANLLLPAMNIIWPYLVACLKHTKPLVVIRCFGVIANAICVCGGDFFIRRFKTDEAHFLKLLSCTSRTQFQEDIAEGTILKVQEAFFQMIAAISRDKKSARALEAIFKQMAGLAVGFSCATTRGPESALQQTATDALLALSNIDPDFIWLLVADIVYSTDSGKLPSPPCPDLPEVAQLLPKSVSPKEYLWVQYAGQNYSLNSDIFLASKLLDKIDSGQDNNLGQRTSAL